MMKMQNCELFSGTNDDVCPLCNGRGWVFIDNNTVKECECGLLERQRQSSLLRFASIPETYKDIKLKDFSFKYYQKAESKEIFKAIAEFVKWYLANLDKFIEEGKGFYLWSDTKGSGKTMLSVAVANELVSKHGKPVKFATSLDILDEIKATYNHEGDGESRLLNDLVATEFLIIDDFGTERATEWAGEKFYQIINKRYIGKKITFFTSNFDLETLKYDDRITSRIRERSFLVHFPEESCRDAKARQENTIEQGVKK